MNYFLTLLLFLFEAISFADSCKQNADCHPDTSLGEPKVCVSTPSASSKSTDQKTLFDYGFQCSCVNAECALVPGDRAKKDLIKSVRAYTESKYAECKDSAIRDISILRWENNSNAIVRMLCSCGMDCGYSCEFEVRLSLTKGVWEIVPKSYKCTVK